jgi:carbon-monoxide dehydrogenase medium subunit
VFAVLSSERLGVREPHERGQPLQVALGCRQEVGLLVGFHLPLRQEGQASAFRRVMRPQGVAIAILNMAVWLERQGDVMAAIRIAAGPTGPVPRRLTATEQALAGRAATEAVLAEALAALLAEAHFRSSRHRSSVAYRRHLAAILLHETLMAAWDEAGRFRMEAIPNTVVAA